VRTIDRPRVRVRARLSNPRINEPLDCRPIILDMTIKFLLYQCNVLDSTLCLHDVVLVTCYDIAHKQSCIESRWRHLDLMLLRSNFELIVYTLVPRTKRHNDVVSEWNPIR